MIGLLTLITTGASVLLASQPVLGQVSGFDPSTLPSSCISTTCQALVNDVQNCTQFALSCLCTNTVYGDLKSCFQCAVAANDGSINATYAQQSLTSFTTGCNSAGYPISGASGSTGSSAAAASGSATGAASASSSTATTAAGSKSDGTLVGVSVGFLGAVVGLAMAGLSL